MRRSKPAESFQMIIAIGDDSYNLQHVNGNVRLRKTDGTIYTITTGMRMACSCLGYSAHKHCKHARACERIRCLLITPSPAPVTRSARVTKIDEYV